MRGFNRSAWSWAFYDWANSAFATTVMAGFFPLFFKQYWAADLGVTDSTFWLGLGNSLAALLVVLLAPVLGVWADRAGMKRRLLSLFALLGVLSSASLMLLQQGQWALALLIYLGGVLGFSSANVAYDAMLPRLVPASAYERLSSLGFALGYLGGGLLFALNVWMVSAPEQFGLADTAEAVRMAFFTVAVWWAVFSVPILLWYPPEEKRAAQAHKPYSTWRGLVHTWQELRTLPVAFTFLIAYWLYIDGVDTIVRMAVDYGLALGFEANDLMAALLLTQVIGFPAALLFGYLGTRIGALRGIWIAILVYILVVLFAYRMQSSTEFYLLAAAIGLVQGGIQALSRALFARLVPRDQAGAFFGLYNMLGKFAAVIGPVLVGVVAVWFDDSRAGILSVLLLFLGAVVLLLRLDVGEGERQARAREVS